jgi:hypothetical protein
MPQATRQPQPIQIDEELRPMEPQTLYRYIKLGMTMEYLSGISSVSIMPHQSLAAFPRLVENLAPNRYSVERVLEALRALRIQLEELGLERAATEADQFQPLVEQLETYLRQHAASSASFMNDSFADKLLFFARQLQLTLKKEASGKWASFADRPGQ